mmetsp:Transcript_6446/g.22969  ORF Transcript_6446/g.22969 Transcript_6446/m.22969 type:complete len:206 (+) Transcript_6446:594-1211(+)
MLGRRGALPILPRRPDEEAPRRRLVFPRLRHWRVRLQAPGDGEKGAVHATPRGRGLSDALCRRAEPRVPGELYGRAHLLCERRGPVVLEQPGFPGRARLENVLASKAVYFLRRHARDGHEVAAALPRHQAAAGHVQVRRDVRRSRAQRVTTVAACVVCPLKINRLCGLVAPLRLSSTSWALVQRPCRAGRRRSSAAWSRRSPRAS